MSRPLVATILLSSIILVKGITGQGFVSPCPDLLRYLPAETTATSWSAEIVLKTDIELTGIWLRLVLDAPPTDVLSEFGEVVQRETSEYLIRRPGFKLSPGVPHTIKVKVEHEGTAPKVVSFRLNANQVCPTETPTNTVGEVGVSSPCPYVFLYDPPGTEPGQWTGTITLSSDAELTGIYSRVTFDKPPLEVTADFGDVVQRETAEYLIRKPGHKLLVGTALKIKLTVRYDPAEGAAPRLSAVRLNAKQICPGEAAPSPTPPPLAKGLVSPCPAIFSYISLDKNAGKWYGQILFNFKQPMQDPQITILLDRPSLQIGGWTGNLKTQDNIEYVLSKPGLVINPGVFPVKFFIKYKSSRPIPKLSEILVNKQQICPEDEASLTNPIAPGSFGSQVTPAPVPTRPNTSPQISGGSDDDYFFVESFNHFQNQGLALSLNRGLIDLRHG